MTPKLPLWMMCSMGTKLIDWDVTCGGASMGNWFKHKFGELEFSNFWHFHHDAFVIVLRWCSMCL